MASSQDHEEEAAVRSERDGYQEWFWRPVSEVLEQYRGYAAPAEMLGTGAAEQRDVMLKRIDVIPPELVGCADIKMISAQSPDWVQEHLRLLVEGAPALQTREQRAAGGR